jgi:acetylornithine deacetylase/succinyl-diaminopimelate desuccinylase-like protein
MNATLEYLARDQSRFVQELCEYIRFPSVSAQPQHQSDMRACAEWLVHHCQQLGLTAQLCPTPGHPIVLAKTPRKTGTTKPHFLVYGHYDVQPPEPLDLWHSPPFEPRLEGNAVFGRGACDNKGQHLAHLKAVEALLKTGPDLPCDLTFVIEGEEEVGSRSLATFLSEHAQELRCAAVVVSDTGMPARGLPALTYALRGVAGLEIKLTGPNRDLHSGIFGGSVDNPAMALCQLLAKLRDRHGRITIPGFYADVKPLGAYERKQLANLPFQAREYARFLGVPTLFGERGYTAWEQRTARPTFEINGLTSGYQGEGGKTIVPAWARAKITIRLVPQQDPDRITRLVCRHLKRLCPKTVRLELSPGHGGPPYLFSPTSPLAQAALQALKTAFAREPVLLREGGSIPIVTDFKRILGADTLLLGLALPDDNAHSPNEKFDLANFAAGMRLGVLLWPALAAALA